MTLAPLARWLVAATLALSSALAVAQQRTVKLLVGFPPGGGTDAIARTLAEKLKDELGAVVVVEDRAGAGAVLAAQLL